jgi:hypothetical protein
MTDRFGRSIVSALPIENIATTPEMLSSAPAKTASSR